MNHQLVTPPSTECATTSASRRLGGAGKRHRRTFLPSSKDPAVVSHPQVPSAQPQEYHLGKEKLISGNPRQTVWLEYEDPSGQFFVGVWSSEVGEWRIRYTEHEYCRILEGRSVITDEHGLAVTVATGSEFTIPAGFSGTWRVEEPTRKRFIIYEAKPPQGAQSSAESAA